MKLLLFLTFSALSLSCTNAKPFNHIDNNSGDTDRFIKSDFEMLMDDVFAFHNSKATATLTSANPDTTQVLNVISITSDYSALSPDDNILLLYDIGINGFQIYNVSNPELPIFISSYHLTSTISVELASAIISFDSKTAFITYADSGIQYLLVVNLTDPTSPTMVTSQALYQNIDEAIVFANSQTVAISPDGNTIFVWTCISSSYTTQGISSIMAAIDVSNITNPQEISHYSEKDEYRYCISTGTALSVADDKLFFNSGPSLLVLDISDLKHPSLVNSINLNVSSGLAVSSDGKNAFVIGAEFNGVDCASLLILDVANPISPINITLGPQLNSQEPQLITISGNNNYLFVAGGDNLMIVNITDIQNVTYNFINTISSPTTIILSSDGRTAYIANNLQVTIVELYLDVQMNHIFTLPAEDNMQEVSLKSNVTYQQLQTMVMTSDRNIAFIMHRDSDLEIYNISNLTSPILLGVYNFIDDCDPVILSPDETVAFLPYDEEIFLVNITDLTSPTNLATYYTDSFFDFDLSLDGKVGFLAMFDRLRSVNLSDITLPADINDTMIPFGYNGVSFGLSQDTSLGFMLLINSSDSDSSQYSVLTINTSNARNLTNLSLIYIGESDSKEGDETLRISISPDNNAIFITVDIDGVDLQIYDISDPSLPVKVTWPGINIPTSQAIVFSKDSKIAFIATSVELLVIDISILASPLILRAYPAPNIVSIVLSQDESIAYLGTANGTLLVITLESEYAFDLWEREYELGGVYSNTLIPLQINSGSKFNPMSQDYSFLEVAFYSVEALPYSTCIVTYPTLPNWMSFESDQQTLTVSPASATQIGLYQIYGTLSTMIPNNTFDHLDMINNNLTAAEDLFASLTSLGYISTQGYLTSNFDPNTKLVLFSQYSILEQDIRQILAQYYIEITTSISIISSLSLSLSDTLLVNTQNQNTLNLVIQVNSSEAQFVSSNYTTVTIISSDYSTISMEGSLANINAALAEIVINLSNNVTECDGSVAISDGLNPPVNQSITNISQYFALNKAPVINSNFSIQAEISQTSIYTGEEFIVDLANTFVDPNGQNLQYSLSMQDTTQEVPGWLTLRGQALVGTPPEQISDSEINLIITAKNQFKSSGIPVLLKVKISVLYGLKLVGTYGGALVTIIGLYIYINTIYNILCKKRYRYPKDFTIKVGDERSVHNICTVGFIGKEVIASKTVFQELKGAVARELNVKSVSKTNFLSYFIDPDTECLLEEKLVSMIKRVIFYLEEKNKFKQDKYLPVKGHLRNDVVQQLVINEILSMQLDLPREKRTKNMFNALKNDWVNLVELGSDPTQFKLNQKELKKRIMEAGVIDYNANKPKNRVVDSSNENIQLNLQLNTPDDTIATNNNPARDISQTPLIDQDHEKARGYSNINFDLLERSIIAGAFRYHNLDVDAFNTRIIINVKPLISTLWVRFKEVFKRDLLQIEFVGRGDTGYGMKYEVRKGILRFYGSPESELKDTTLVVHITNKRGRILRELWLLCIGKE